MYIIALIYALKVDKSEVHCYNENDEIAARL